MPDPSLNPPESASAPELPTASIYQPTDLPSQHISADLVPSEMDPQARSPIGILAETPALKVPSAEGIQIPDLPRQLSSDAQIAEILEAPDRYPMPPAQAADINTATQAPTIADTRYPSSHLQEQSIQQKANDLNLSNKSLPIAVATTSGPPRPLSDGKIIHPASEYDLTTDPIHKHASFINRIINVPGCPAAFQPAYDVPAEFSSSREIPRIYQMDT